MASGHGKTPNVIAVLQLFENVAGGSLRYS